MILAVNGVEFPIEGKGDVKLCFNGNVCILKRVLYSHKLRKNLISGPMLDQNGFRFEGGNSKIVVYCKNTVVFIAKLKQGLYDAYPDNEIQACNVQNEGNYKGLME